MMEKKMETTGLGFKISSNCWSASASAIQPTSTVVATLLLSFLVCSHLLPCGSCAIMPIYVGSTVYRACLVPDPVSRSCIQRALKVIKMTVRNAPA